MSNHDSGAAALGKIDCYDDAMEALRRISEWAAQHARFYPDMPGHTFRAALDLAFAAFNLSTPIAYRLENMHHDLRHALEGMNDGVWQEEALAQDEDEEPAPEWLVARLFEAERAVKGLLPQPRKF